eukprot:gnl/MRDRNA2_/MRDRNA2_59739_c0_seq2.p1 gnl/MRDRNA2_/MRDRNA2_59739_c0~~gnl/MRDRNA2_/MRDRNA2_59739_c0_seq2.p1  ORF type:complete len:335 (+),score=41.35 gnl/MRDRNA2_/MRDRNA2_59739_c0_seq2:43-1005(+)
MPLAERQGDVSLVGVGLLQRLGRWEFDAAVLFVCTGEGRREWRQVLSDHGLGTQLHYFHFPRDDLEGFFDSRPFLPEAFTPVRLQMHLVGSDKERKFVSAGKVAGHERTAVDTPLIDVVELCPVTSSSETENLDPEEDFEGKQAWVVHNACSPQKKVVEQAATGYASVRCCFGRADPTSNNRGCTTVWFMRNTSVNIYGTHVGSCLPQSATYHEALRTCEVVGGRLCNSHEILECCSYGCRVNHISWLESPLQHGQQSPQVMTRAMKKANGASPKIPTKTKLRQMREDFLKYSEEAVSTIVEWPFNADFEVTGASSGNAG